jgi:hypothetical protein
LSTTIIIHGSDFPFRKITTIEQFGLHFFVIFKFKQQTIADAVGTSWKNIKINKNEEN